MIKSIDTRYKNHLFRSRLEARYAVLFDALNIKWLYEHEGFELGGTERYLPDFYLPHYDLYAEVKPKSFSFKEHSKCKRLALLTTSEVIELVGLPSFEPITVITPSKHYICPIYGQEWVYKDPRSLICKCGVKHRVFNTINESQGIFLFEKYKAISYDMQKNGNQRIEKAIRLATEARFEFNNKL